MSKVKGIFPLFLATAFGIGNGMRHHIVSVTVY